MLFNPMKPRRKYENNFLLLVRERVREANDVNVIETRVWNYEAPMATWNIRLAVQVKRLA